MHSSTFPLWELYSCPLWTWRIFRCALCTPSLMDFQNLRLSAFAFGLCEFSFMQSFTFGILALVLLSAFRLDFWEFSLVHSFTLVHVSHLDLGNFPCALLYICTLKIVLLSAFLLDFGNFPCALIYFRILENLLLSLLRIWTWGIFLCALLYL